MNLHGTRTGRRGIVGQLSPRKGESSHTGDCPLASADCVITGTSLRMRMCFLFLYRTRFFLYFLHPLFLKNILGTKGRGEERRAEHSVFFATKCQRAAPALDGWLPITAGAAFEKTTEKEHKRNATAAAAVTTVTALYRTIHHGCFLGLLLPTPHCATHAKKKLAGEEHACMHSGKLACFQIRTI
jgi:hypothetical protein